MTGTLAITMAGKGSRFARGGYARPKYEIEALGRPLFDWSMLGMNAFLKSGWECSFAVPAGREAEAFVARRAIALGIEVRSIVVMDDITDGQATTALHLAEAAPRNRPFAVFNIDTFVNPAALSFPLPGEAAGWMLCFPAPGEGWSFARLDDEGRVVEVREKMRISDHATVGLYWFDSATRYIDAYHSYYAVPGRETAGERYVAPLYNQLISEGAPVTLARLALQDVGMLGTPAQLADFVAHPPPAALPYAGPAAAH
ncbi:MAG: dTDP-glucose pyrophosphorylase [Pseudomonadota bacterium]